MAASVHFWTLTVQKWTRLHCRTPRVRFSRNLFSESPSAMILKNELQ